MRFIYKQARNLLVWLGEGTKEQEMALIMIPVITETLKVSGATGSSLDPEDMTSFETLNIPSRHDQIWRHIGGLMTCSWFGRLWTLQEVVLPEKEKISVYLGSEQITWSILELASWVRIGLRIQRHQRRRTPSFIGQVCGMMMVTLSFLRSTHHGRDIRST